MGAEAVVVGTVVYRLDPQGVIRPLLKVDSVERTGAARVVSKADLLERWQAASESVGDGLGFDVESFDAADDSPLRIEVKTTGLGKYHPFLVTENEVRCSEDEPSRYHLYRVFEFSSGPWVYVLQGSLRVRCRLQPVLYRAGF